MILKFLDILVHGTTTEWSALRLINHTDMAELLEQVIQSSLMDNSTKVNNMAIIDILAKMVAVIIMNIQMVHGLEGGSEYILIKEFDYLCLIYLFKLSFN